MATICLALHAHQPCVLRRFSVFDSGIHYFDAYKSRDACRRFVARSVLPVNRTLHGLIRRHEGRFRVSCSISGTSLDLFERHAPEAIASFADLVATGAVELLAMPYHNSLAALYSPTAFREQVELHRARVEGLFDCTPQVFRNSEMIYGDALAEAAAEMGLKGVLCDGAFDVLSGRSCSRVYAGGERGVPLLLRNERLSRDVAERFVDRGWDQWPLTAPRFAEWLGRFDRDEVITLAWDYATFGLNIGSDTGIFDFLRYLPDKVLEQEGQAFATAGEVIVAVEPADAYRPQHFVSTAERHWSLSPWLGNPMQSHAMHHLFSLEPALREAGDAGLLGDWRRLQACEYVAAMNTSTGERGGAWYAQPDSPYDAYINFMNVCDSVASRAGVEVDLAAR